MTLTEHDHSGPDSACLACKPLADVLRDRMRWPSLHWGELHPDAYASLARAVHEAGYDLFASRERAAAEKAWDEGYGVGANRMFPTNPYRAGEIRNG